MTEQELRQLDHSLSSGEISEDEYLATLRDEVARIHHDYEPIDIDNMFKMQLRILALDEELSEDTSIDAAEFRQVRLHACKESENGDPAERAECRQDQLPQPEEREESKHNAEKSEDSLKSEPPEPEKEKEEKEEQKQDKPQQQDKKDIKSQSKQQDKKDKSKSKSSPQKWWWTWQIVPDWNEWMKDEQQDKPQMQELQPSVIYHPVPIAEIEDREDVIDLTEGKDGVFELREEGEAHE